MSDYPEFNPEPIDEDSEWARAAYAPLAECPECGVALVDTDYVGADGRSVCDDCRERD